MVDRMQVFTADELNLIHDASIDILMETGVKFNAEAALDIFRRHDFNTDGNRVFISPKGASLI